MEKRRRERALRYFYGDYVAAALYIAHHFKLNKGGLADLAGYTPQYLSELLARKQYSPEAETRIMGALHQRLRPRMYRKPPAASTYYHLQLSSRSLDAAEAFHIDCYGDIICLVQFIMSAYGMSREELAACMGRSFNTVQKLLEPMNGHPSEKQQNTIEAGIQQYFQNRGPSTGELCGRVRYVVGIQKQLYFTADRRHLLDELYK